MNENKYKINFYKTTARSQRNDCFVRNVTSGFLNFIYNEITLKFIIEENKISSNDLEGLA